MRENHAVYIGRFQPFHRSHLAVVEKGLELADHLTIVVGSANAAPNIRNPWTFEERKTMIVAACASLQKTQHQTPIANRLSIVPVRDYFYNENTWIAEVQAKTAAIGVEDGALLLGNYKDGSSYYLRFFPQWEMTPVRVPVLDATSIRETLFAFDVKPDWEGKPSQPPDISELSTSLSGPVYQFIQNWVRTAAYCNLAQEAKFIKGYHAAWANAPYPPTFVTVDAVVTCSGHVLVVKRKLNPGKGLYALPGGFLKPKEKLRAGMLRELREETKIQVSPLILESAIVDDHVFDNPERSLRGRTITQGFHLQLKDGQLPEVRPGDDAAQCEWMPLMDVAKNETAFFEDHAHIITYFVGAQGGR